MLTVYISCALIVYYVILIMQALIISDAYKQTMWIDWISPLYRKVIIRGDFQYLGLYKSAFPLTPSLFQELASKYVYHH